MLDPGIIDDGALAVAGGLIAAIGTGKEILSKWHAADKSDQEVIDAGGRVVCPGFVDPHTHVVYAGDRLNEFELKIKGASYLDIASAGGGIVSTVKATRDASVAELAGATLKRLDRMLSCGTTTCEIKTGYGLDSVTELRMLEAIANVHRDHPITVVPTFLAAHTFPPEYKANPEKYVNLVCDTMLSEAWKWFVSSPFHGKVPFFCDVFCETGAFSVSQTRKILETAKSLGYKLKAHVDQFTNLGGSRLSIELGATSIDHLDVISDEEVELLARSSTVGVVIPTENFSAGKTEFANARDLIDADCAVALSTDYNPGTAPCPSMPMAMAIACRYQKLSPSEALCAATINGAHAIGLSKNVGSLEVGKKADLLIIDAKDYRAMAYEFGSSLVSTVVKGGKVAL